MNYKVVKIERDKVDLERAILEAIADAWTESAVNAMSHPSPDRRSEPVLIYFNAGYLTGKDSDRELYLNDTAFNVLHSKGLNLVVQRELPRLPENVGKLFSADYFF